MQNLPAFLRTTGKNFWLPVALSFKVATTVSKACGWYYNIVANLLQLYIVLGTTLLCKHTTFFFAFWESFPLPLDYTVVPVAIGWFIGH